MQTYACAEDSSLLSRDYASLAGRDASRATMASSQTLASLSLRRSNVSSATSYSQDKIGTHSTHGRRHAMYRSCLRDIRTMIKTSFIER